MPIRLTGMNSGLDTESIITELVKAQKTKSESIKKKQTALEWKQDAWKELNSKIYKLFNGTLSNMRFTTDYSKKTTDVSNSSIANIITGDEAMNATQQLKVTKLATSGYMTGAKLSGDITKDSNLVSALGIDAGSVISVSTGGKTTDITITSDMTVDGFLEELKSAGVEANFDVLNQRFHIAAKESGTDGDFTIVAGNATGTDALSKLGILNYDTDALAEYQKYAGMTGDEKAAAINADVASRLQGYITQKASLEKTLENQNKTVEEHKTSFSDKFNGEDIETALADKDTLKADIDALKAEIEAAGDSAEEADKEELANLESKLAEIEKYETEKAQVAATEQSIANVDQYMTTVDGEVVASGVLKDEVTAQWEAKIANAQYIIVNKDTLGAGSGVKKVDGQDAQITLNGVDYTSNSNTFEVNGLTITALTESTETVTITTRQDTDGIYDMIKDFFTEYNALINEMDKLYNADSTKNYEPLSDEEKDELTDTEIEKWEEKIKGSILRKDSNLSSVSSAMKNIMLQGATVNGEKMYLSNFGIETLGYFLSEDNERNAYHINGDEDDSSVSSQENTLKAKIASDPDSVVAFFSQLANNLYTELNNQSRSVEGMRSFGSFYDDKKMKEDYSDYTQKIQDEEDKLTALEDRWYNKFTAMETALAKLQSNQSAVSSLLGG